MKTEPQKEHQWLQKLVGVWTYEGDGIVGILMTQHIWTSASPQDVCLDFRTSAHQAIEDRGASRRKARSPQ